MIVHPNRCTVLSLQARDVFMSPQKLSGIMQFLNAVGPIELCKNSAGEWALFPSEVPIAGSNGLLQALQQQAEIGSKHLSGLDVADKPKQEDIADVSETTETVLTPGAVKTHLLGVMGQAVLTDDNEFNFIFNKNPGYAAAFSMCQSMRGVSLHSSRCIGTWCAQENAEHNFLAPGYLGQLTDLDKAN